MRALFNYQRDKYIAEWYRQRGEEPPDLNVKTKPHPYHPPEIMTLTTTTVLKGNHKDQIQNCSRMKRSTQSSNNESNQDENPFEDTDMFEEEDFPEEENSEEEPLSYWETEGAGIEPPEFQIAKAILQSDTVVSWKEHPPIGQGEITACYTPYQNDQMTFQAFELARHELQRKTQQLAEEMKRVDIIFNRPPKKNWFVKQKGVNFTIEHCRFLEMQRRRAQRFANPE